VQDESPQLENGYTKLANELLDALISAGLTARQWAVSMAIIRKTYGFNKKADEIGLSQLAAMTGIDKAHLSRTVRELEAAKIIHRSAGVHGHSLSINKKYRQWELPKEQQKGLPNKQSQLPKEQPQGLLNEQPLPNQQRGDCQNSNGGVAESANLGLLNEQPQNTYQKTTPKETIKRRANALERSPEFEEAWSLYPKRDGGNSPADAWKAWSARVKAGVAPADLLAGTKRYAAYCVREKKVGTQFVKQASTFYGKGEHYAESWGGKIGEETVWWQSAGFDKEWQATNAGCTERTAYLWRDGKRTDGKQ
jgi:phage replication O-like protein O